MVTAYRSPPFLAAIDTSNYHGLDQILQVKELAYAGGLVTTVTATSLDTAFSLLQEAVGRLPVYLEVSALTSQQQVIDLLDAGASKIFVSSQQAAELKLAKGLDLRRVVYRPTASIGADEQAVDGSSFGLFLQNVGNVQKVSGILQELGKNRPPVYVSHQHITQEEAVELCRQDAVPIIPANRLTLAAEPSPTQISVAALLLSQVTSDRSDGLFTTLVTDERGIALGLVYSNQESVAESLRSGRGVYHSRKRGLWRKGDTSGDWQQLVRIDVDCDQDTICFVVRQQGHGFCHLQTATCFGQYRGLARLQKTLQSRKQSAPEGSYTARLFKDSRMLNSKIMEEASELCEAETKEHIAFEAADLLYFALTKAVAAGVSLEEIERNLDFKSLKVKRRKGDAKGPYAERYGVNGSVPTNGALQKQEVKEAEFIPKSKDDLAGTDGDDRIQMNRLVTADVSFE